MKKSDRNSEVSAKRSGLPLEEELISNSKEVNLVILAAGVSSRMKENSSKTLKKIKEESILNRVIRQFDPFVSKIYVVTGFMSQEVQSHVDKKDRVEFVYNKKFQKDKNVLSCFLGLEKIKSGASLVIEGDVILTKEDVDKVVENIRNVEQSFVCSQKFSEKNKKRIGIVGQKIRILDKPDENVKENRMSGLFFFSSLDVKMLKKDQKKKIDSEDFSDYYFFPLLENPKKYNIKNVEISSFSHTVNTKEEFKWAVSTFI